jgi:hypothetical protein
MLSFQNYLFFQIQLTFTTFIKIFNWPISSQEEQTITTCLHLETLEIVKRDVQT